jgi:hypothetical protein
LVQDPESRGGIQIVSSNYRFYATRMAALRVHREVHPPLSSQLDELFEFVWRCELQWV